MSVVIAKLVSKGPAVSSLASAATCATPDTDDDAVSESDAMVQRRRIPTTTHTHIRFSYSTRTVPTRNHEQANKGSRPHGPAKASDKTRGRYRTLRLIT